MCQVWTWSFPHSEPGFQSSYSSPSVARGEERDRWEREPCWAGQKEESTSLQSTPPSQGPLGSADSWQLKKPLQTPNDSCNDYVVQKHKGFKLLISASPAPRTALKEILGILSKYWKGEVGRDRICSGNSETGNKEQCWSSEPYKDKFDDQEWCSLFVNPALERQEQVGSRPTCFEWVPGQPGLQSETVSKKRWGGWWGLVKKLSSYAVFGLR